MLYYTQFDVGSLLFLCIYLNTNKNITTCKCDTFFFLGFSITVRYAGKSATYEHINKHNTSAQKSHFKRIKVARSFSDCNSLKSYTWLAIQTHSDFLLNKNDRTTRVRHPLAAGAHTGLLPQHEIGHHAMERDESHNIEATGHVHTIGQQIQADKQTL